MTRSIGCLWRVITPVCGRMHTRQRSFSVRSGRTNYCATPGAGAHLTRRAMVWVPLCRKHRSIPACAANGSSMCSQPARLCCSLACWRWWYLHFILLARWNFPARPALRRWRPRLRLPHAHWCWPLRPLRCKRPPACQPQPQPHRWFQPKHRRQCLCQWLRASVRHQSTCARAPAPILPRLLI